MALGNYFFNMGNITFGNMPCFQTFNGWNAGFCNFSMPTFTTPFTYNFNSMPTIFQNPYFNNGYNSFVNNYSFSFPNFNGCLNFNNISNTQSKSTVEFNSTPSSTDRAYSSRSFATYSSPTYNTITSDSSTPRLNISPSISSSSTLNSSSSSNSSSSLSLSSTSTSSTSHSRKNSLSTTPTKPKVSTTFGFLDDYNANKGQKLATTALNNSVGWSGYCAKYVKTAIKDAGLGNYTSGHAYQMTDILNNNSNFRQISTTGVNVDDLPAGCILVFNKGAQGYSSQYGHVEITTGDGRAVSDGITNNLKKPSAIFIPV